MSVVSFVCDGEERVVGSQQAPGSYPYCGGKVMVTDVETLSAGSPTPSALGTSCSSTPPTSHKRNPGPLFPPFLFSLSFLGGGGVPWRFEEHPTPACWGGGIGVDVGEPPAPPLPQHCPGKGLVAERWVRYQCCQADRPVKTKALSWHICAIKDIVHRNTCIIHHPDEHNHSPDSSSSGSGLLSPETSLLSARSSSSCPVSRSDGVWGYSTTASVTWYNAAEEVMRLEEAADIFFVC
ncbi:hypothetical protein Taro_007351 [Colocasia esculenta]|uniref:Uncharacterized protein n=1 Tax=Colocasia esculenta TaxID=4460 RepID=A0A843U063_COLES|nr:hypothetical protein [Colocasia esculenta]